MFTRMPSFFVFCDSELPLVGCYTERL